MKFSIRNYIIEVNYEDPVYKSYLNREFSLMQVNDLKSKGSDIKISILTCRYDPGHLKKQVSENFWSDGKALFHRFKAFNRLFWIKYLSLKEAVLYIPYKESDYIGRFVSPFYENRAEGCATDFFHNSFLGLLQLHLLDNNGSLFHCSGLQYQGKNFVFTGCGQSGKSSLLGTISKLVPIKYIAEDFGCLYTDGVLYGYPHQSRVKEQDLNKSGSLYFSIANRINLWIFKYLTRSNNGRHFSVKDIYPNTEFCRAGVIDQCFFLERTGERVTTTAIDGETMSKKSLDVIKIEFNNMKNLRELVDNFYTFKFSNRNFEMLINDTWEIYNKTFRHITGMLLELPYYEDIFEAGENIIDLMREI